MPSSIPQRPTAFTLVEVALALAVMGLIGAMTFPLLSHLLNQQKVARTETILETARGEALGFALNTFTLPESIAHFGHQTDGWGTELIYEKAAISDLCAFFDGTESPVLLQINLPQGRTIEHVAVVLISLGRNRSPDTEYAPETGTITVRAPGEEINGKRSDDLLVYITSDFLRSKVWERCPVAPEN